LLEIMDVAEKVESKKEIKYIRLTEKGLDYANVVWEEFI